MNRIFNRKPPEKFKKESRSFFGRIAGTYDRIAAFERPAHLQVIERLNRFSYNSVLDVGCGTGALLSDLAKINTQANLAGIDITPEMIGVAGGKLGQRAELVVGDVENLPWQENTFDAVVSTYAFHHFPRPKVALTEINRVLKPEGILIIADLWLPSPVRQLTNLLIRFIKTGDVHVYSKAEITSLLSESGFKSIGLEKANMFTLIVTANK